MYSKIEGKYTRKFSFRKFLNLLWKKPHLNLIYSQPYIKCIQQNKINKFFYQKNFSFIYKCWVLPVFFQQFSIQIFVCLLYFFSKSHKKLVWNNIIMKNDMFILKALTHKKNLSSLCFLVFGKTFFSWLYHKYFLFKISGNISKYFYGKAFTV